MAHPDAQDARIADILGDMRGNIEYTFEDCVNKFYQHLTDSLQLPCDVTGVEDFRWEEFYVVGPGDSNEHERLRRNQPSYVDMFELLAIETGVCSEWMMFYGEDLAARVRRQSDGKEFYLGLAEIKAVDKKSINYQLFDDYAFWFVNNR